MLLRRQISGGTSLLRFGQISGGTSLPPRFGQISCGTSLPPRFGQISLPRRHIHFDPKKTFLYASPQSTTTTPLPEFYIVDSTLREGEQFSSAEFSSAERIYIAKLLDNLGVDYIEVQNPAASDTAAEECSKLSKLGLRAKIVAHTRCHIGDVTKAVEAGVQGVHCYMATSQALRDHSHGKGIDAITQVAGEVVQYVKKHGVEVRFSCEDTFRSNVDEVLSIYQAVDSLGVDRVGIADTVGLATPMQVYNTVAQVKSVLRPTTGIELHVHNDTGCCIANALMAMEAGATHIDTTILGLGERNGITPLGGLLARLYTIDKEAIKARFNLNLLHSLDKYLSQIARVSIPFNNYITGSAAFTHKAGVHSKAVVSNPGSYEVINPEDFGVTRVIQLAHRLTGWNALKHRCQMLGLSPTDDQIKSATQLIKNIADVQEVTQAHVDAVLLRLASLPNITELTTTHTTTKDDDSTTTTTAEVEAAAHTARVALETYQKAILMDAIQSVVPSEETIHKPTMLLTISGHLFDSGVINRLLDVAVDSPCDFKVINTIIPPCNEETSKVVIRLSAEQKKQLDETLKLFTQCINDNDDDDGGYQLSTEMEEDGMGTT